MSLQGLALWRSLAGLGLRREKDVTFGVAKVGAAQARCPPVPGSKSVQAPWYLRLNQRRRDWL